MNTTRGQLHVEIEDMKCGPMSRIIGDHKLGYTKLGSERSQHMCGKREKRKRGNKSPKDTPKVSISNSDRNSNKYFYISNIICF